MVFDHKCASQILAELANKYIIHKQGPDIALFFYWNNNVSQQVFSRDSRVWLLNKWALEPDHLHWDPSSELIV